ncbi:hypothetical protein ACIBCT_36210 [Streptosporangium sp. NPDC050855]|uniref:hypothetical protein n=1 Tax=Streptosporangium sp. NPDC050855 TaxID=3366194 RepID=UPI0037AEB514
MTAEKRRQHDQEFHDGAGRIARETRRLISQVARETGVSEDALRESVAGDLGEPPPVPGTGPETSGPGGTAHRPAGRPGLDGHLEDTGHPEHAPPEPPPAPRLMGGCVI